MARRNALPPLASHPTTEYAQKVVSGEIVAGVHIINACKRHLNDLANGHERGLYFDVGAANHVYELFERYLPHVKGEWASFDDPRIQLELWQKWVIGSIYGWKRWHEGDERYYRRFKEAHIEIARKNAKSTLGAGIGIYALVGDGEFGAEVYSLATKREQARIVFDSAAAMVRRSRALRRQLRSVRDALLYDKQNAFFKPLPASDKSLDGLNPSCAIVDELHNHKNGNVYNVIKGGRGARRQPLLCVITTSGLDQASFAFGRRKYCEKIAAGEVEADDVFVAIYAIDDADDWADETVWIKANPNLGVSIDIDEMRAACRDARFVPHEQAEFIAKRCNRWTSNLASWMPMDKWDACTDPIDLEALKGRKCFAAIDVGERDDLSALVLVFPPEKDGEKWVIVPRFYTPLQGIADREKKVGAPYSAWIQRGLMIGVPGNTIANEEIRADIKALSRDFKIQEIAFDAWGANEMTQNLEADGFTVVSFPQVVKTFSEPTKKLLYLTLDGEIAHGGNEVLRWMASNVTVFIDGNGNIKPLKNAAKRGSRSKIDGIVAAIMALDRAMRHKPKRSYFSNR